MSEGTGAAIERLYREEGDRLWRAVYFWSGDRDIADDAVAEAFAQALRCGDAIRDPRAWMWRSVFRIAAGELKMRRRQDHWPHESSYDLPEAPAQLATALRRLSPKQRASVVLHHYAGYSLKEVAAIIGSTPAAVAVHFHRGRAHIKEAMSDED
ncbi:MAG: sigma-70 family RNA polymerase sigma factor [Actinobacteria bacterium]|nr:sigma-70 family RNA polymerase sigma factor [Actinomycetota bacterium]